MKSTQLIHACVADRLEQYDQIAATQNYEADSKTSWPACKRIKGEASVKTFMSALGTLNLLKRCVVDCNFFLKILSPGSSFVIMVVVGRSPTTA